MASARFVFCFFIMKRLKHYISPDTRILFLLTLQTSELSRENVELYSLTLIHQFNVY